MTDSGLRSGGAGGSAARSGGVWGGTVMEHRDKSRTSKGPRKRQAPEDVSPAGRPLQTTDCYRHAGVCRGPVAYLTEVVVPPAFNGVAGDHCAGGVATSRD